MLADTGRRQVAPVRIAYELSDNMRTTVRIILKMSIRVRMPN